MQTLLPISVIEKEVLFELNGFTAQLCISEESKNIAYSLRYDSYIHSGAIDPRPNGILIDKYDPQPNMRTHLIWHNGAPVASVRSGIWSKKYNFLPVESIQHFRSDVEREIGLEENILESSRYVVAPHLSRRDSFFAQLLMFRIQDLSSVFDNCSTIITSVKERHAPFYSRMLAFEQISGPIPHDYINLNVVLLKTSQEESRKIITSKGMPPCSPEEVNIYTQLANKLNESN